MNAALALVVLTAVSAQDPAEPPPPPPFDDEVGEEEAPPPPPVDPPTASPDSPDGQSAPKVEGKAGSPGEKDFFAKYFPFSFEDPLHPAVDENLWTFWVGLLVPFGQLWLPFIVIDDVPKDYFVDALLIYIVHVVPHVILSVLAFAPICLLPCAAVPYVGLLCIPIIPLSIFGCHSINGLLGLANGLYLIPVALANSMSDHMNAVGSTALPVGRRVRRPGERATRRAALDALLPRRATPAMAF